MKDENYHTSITVHANARDVFQDICNVSGWWTKNVEGNSSNLDDVFTVHFGETFVTFKITGFIPDNKIVWCVTESHLPWLKDKKEWNHTTVIFDIAESNGSSTITMTHVGLTPAVECYENCEKGWNFYSAQSLVKLINEGEGKPDTPPAQR